VGCCFRNFYRAVLELDVVVDGGLRSSVVLGRFCRCDGLR
jgi:hypothetical protein